MKKTYLLFLLLCSCLQLIGQNNYTISGQIIDSETKEPLPYATIAYQIKSTGTFSNDDGFFTLSVFGAKPTDSISISYIGYKTLKTTIEEGLKTDVFKLDQDQYQLQEITVTSDKLNLNKFMKEAITLYNKNKRKDPHIAIAHYREKAMEDGAHIMFMESIGYSVFSGRQFNAALLSNYKFFCDNSKCLVDNPKWLNYGSKNPGQESQKPIPGGGSNLNALRFFEERGILSKKEYSKYKYSIDSSYTVGSNQVLSINFEGDIAQGNIHIFAESKHIYRIECTTDIYYTRAFEKRLEADIDFVFNYFDETPFISTIHARYIHKGLTYSNSFKVLLQKFNEFNLNKDEYWSFNNYDMNPYIIYDAEAWKKSGIKTDPDMEKIATDLNIDPKGLEEVYKSASDQWFRYPDPRGALARQIVAELIQNF
jgi:hypothetical protein